MDKLNQNRIHFLLSLIAPKLTSVHRIKLLEEVDTISGFDLIFILSLIIRNKYSGNLNIVNEENEISSVFFIYGDIVKVDHPDQEFLLGNIILDKEFFTSPEIEVILQEAAGYRLGDYLISKRLLTEEQLREVLFTQTRLRLTKYINNKNIRIHFTFDGQSIETTLISHVNFFEILYRWIFENFESEWLIPFAEYYGTNIISTNIELSEYKFLREFADVYPLVEKLESKSKQQMTYHELFILTNMTKPVFIRSLHFLVLCGFIVVKRAIAPAAVIGTIVRVSDLTKLDEDLVHTKILMLNKKYFEALGLLNKYATLSSSHEKVNFYIIWVKLTGAFYNNLQLDMHKLAKDLSEIDVYQLDPGEYYYVRSLLAAIQKGYRESDEFFIKAVSYDRLYKNYPINDNSSFLNIIKKFFNSLKITG